jgi:hypothetical protein
MNQICQNQFYIFKINFDRSKYEININLMTFILLVKLHFWPPADFYQVNAHVYSYSHTMSAS